MCNVRQSASTHILPFITFLTFRKPKIEDVFERERVNWVNCFHYLTLTVYCLWLTVFVRERVNVVTCFDDKEGLTGFTVLSGFCGTVFVGVRAAGVLAG